MGARIEQVGLMTDFVLYRMYGTEGALLYVGRTVDPGARLRHHKDRKPWWDEITEIKLERFDTDAEIADAERTAIRVENPTYNSIRYTYKRPQRIPPFISVETFVRRFGCLPREDELICPDPELIHYPDPA